MLVLAIHALGSERQQYSTEGATCSECLLLLATRKQLDVCTRAEFRPQRQFKRSCRS
jgi:hypothetical protein